MMVVNALPIRLIEGWNNMKNKNIPPQNTIGKV
jgi:hypothetical protein